MKLTWFRAKTSLWHLWRLTPEGREGTQWTECLKIISNPVTYADKPKGGNLCADCAAFARYVREQEKAREDPLIKSGLYNAWQLQG